MDKTKTRVAKTAAGAKATGALKKTASAKKAAARKKTVAMKKTVAANQAAAGKKAVAGNEAAASKKMSAAKKVIATGKSTARKTTAVVRKAAASKQGIAAKPEFGGKPASVGNHGADAKAAKSANRSGGGASTANATDATRLIDAKIAALADWRGETLARLREIIRQADPHVVEEWKWGIPVWSHDGILCTGETYKNAVKTTFPHGAALDDPSGLFNSSLAGNTRRAIDFHVGTTIDANALTALIRAAVALNTAKKAGSRPTRPAKR